MAEIEVQMDIQVKMARLQLLINRFESGTEQPGDYAEAVGIVQYLTELVQARNDSPQTMFINILLTVFNRLSGRM